MENSCFHNQPSTKNDGSEEYPIPLGEKRKCTQNSPLFFIYCFECMLLPKFYPFFRQCYFKNRKCLFSPATIHLPRIGYNTPSFNWYGTERLLRKHLVCKGIQTSVYPLWSNRSQRSCNGDSLLWPSSTVAWVRFSDLVDVLVELVCGSHPCSDVFSQVSSCFFLS